MTNLTRRSALAGAVTLPVLPVGAFAKAAATPNATDAPWRTYQKALAALQALEDGRRRSPLPVFDDGSIDHAVDAVCDAVQVFLDTPAATLVDVERKLTMLHRWHCDPEPENDIATLLSDVRSLLGRAA